LLSITAFCALADPAAAAVVGPPDVPRPLVLPPGVSAVELAPHVAVLEDCGDSLTVDDVAHGPAAQGFRRVSARGLSFGYSSCAIWVRLDLVCPGGTCDDWLLAGKNPRADHVDLYRDGAIERSGSRVAMSGRPIRAHYPVFALGPMPAGATRLHLRLQTTDVASYPLALIRRSAFPDSAPRDHLLLGIYFGIMLFTALFSAVVFVYLRDRAYLLYALFIACYGMFEFTLNGLDIAYLWPEQPFWHAPAIPFWCGLTVVSGAAFSARFLMLRQYAPALRYLVYGVLVSGLVMLAVTAFGGFTLAGILGSLLAPAAVITFGVAALVAMLRGCPHARYFLLAGTLQFLGVVLNALRNFAILPPTVITTYGGQIGSTLFMLLVSLALMARFDLLRREKENAQEEAYRSHRSAADARRVTAELRLQALQAKINPHFLFNTLNTIAGLIAEGPERAQGVVIRLSRLFRYTLAATTKDRVLLTEELSIVRSYLEIERERFGERLRFDIQVDGDIEGLTLPGLTLQPLVENCVKHGLRPKVEGGRVTVGVRVAGEELLLTVADDGVGMDPTLDTDGHGLQSVRERLRLVYGADASLSLKSPPGVRIEIRIPATR